jgi:hypothetical protein
MADKNDANKAKDKDKAGVEAIKRAGKSEKVMKAFNAKYGKKGK